MTHVCVVFSSVIGLFMCFQATLYCSNYFVWHMDYTSSILGRWSNYFFLQKTHIFIANKYISSHNLKCTITSWKLQKVLLAAHKVSQSSKISKKPYSNPSITTIIKFFFFRFFHFLLLCSHVENYSSIEDIFHLSYGCCHANFNIPHLLIEGLSCPSVTGWVLS